MRKKSSLFKLGEHVKFRKYKNAVEICGTIIDKRQIFDTFYYLVRTINTTFVVQESAIFAKYKYPYDGDKDIKENTKRRTIGRAAALG